MKIALEFDGKEARRAWFSALAGLLLGLLGFWAMGRPLETPVLKTLLSGPFPGGARGLGFLDRIYPTIQLGLCLVLGGFAWMRGRTVFARNLGVRFAVVPLATSLVTSLLKEHWARPRPQHPDSGLNLSGLLTALADRESFPSGHASVSASVAALLILTFAGKSRWCFGALALPLLMSWSRVALAVHWPSDVVAGTGLGFLVAGALTLMLREKDPALPASWPRAWIAFAALLIVTASWPDRSRILDPGSGAPLDWVSLEPRFERILFEPWVGWPLEWAYASEARNFVLGAIPWVGLGLCLLLWLPRGAPARVRFLRALGCLLWIGVMGGLALRGSLPADRWRSAESGIFVDLHVHGSDPVDGAMDATTIRERSRARGIAELAWTNHDAPPPLAGSVPGVEWSAFAHPRAVVPHLLVLGGDQAIARVLELPPVPVSADGEADLSRFRALVTEMVTIAKAAGAIVVVAHDWRTWSALGDRGVELPTPEEWAAMGVHGFEVGNRHPETSARGLDRLHAIEDVARREGLLRIATSDDHGIPAGSPCITFLRGTFSEDPTTRVSEILAALREPSRVQPIVATRGRGVAPLPLRAPVAVWRYFAALSVPSRLSWLGWVIVIAVLGRRRRPTQ